MMALWGYCTTYGLLWHSSWPTVWTEDDITGDDDVEGELDNKVWHIYWQQEFNFRGRQHFLHLSPHRPQKLLRR